MANPMFRYDDEMTELIVAACRTCFITPLALFGLQ